MTLEQAVAPQAPAACIFVPESVAEEQGCCSVGVAAADLTTLHISVEGTAGLTQTLTWF